MKTLDLNMMEIFKAELETHARALEKGLVKIESEQDTKLVEPLMRAAHSIKGAAKIVGLDTAAGLAHYMEDVFIALQKNGKTPTAEIIDALLKANDHFLDLLNYPASEHNNILESKKGEITSVENVLKSICNGKKVETAPQKMEVKESSVTVIDEKIQKDLIPVLIPEIETHSSALINETEKFVNDAGADELKQFVRAAHSLKGAFKISGMVSGAELAAKIENAGNQIKDISQIQRNSIAEIIGKYVELISTLAGLSEDKFESGYFEIIGQLRQLSGDFENTKNLIAGDNLQHPVEPILNVIETDPVKPTLKEAAPEIKRNETSGEETYLRILPQSLTDLLALSGEVMVEARSMKNFSKMLLDLKDTVREFESSFEAMDYELRSQEHMSYMRPLQESSKMWLDSASDKIQNFIANFENFSLRLESSTEKLYNKALETRMKPFSEGLHGFERMVRSIAKQLGKQLKLEIIGGNTPIDRDILDKLEAPLTHLVRNSIDHGVELPDERERLGKSREGSLRIEAVHRAGMFVVTIKDDGRGIDVEKLRKKVVERGFTNADMASQYTKAELLDFLFLPGFSTAEQITEISGRGVGLDVVFTMVHEVGGTIKIDTEPGIGTAFILQLPLTLSVVRALIFKVGGNDYALPLTRIDQILRIGEARLKVAENKTFVDVEGENIGIVPAYRALDMDGTEEYGEKFYVIIISDRLGKYGISAASVCGSADLVAIPLDKRLGKIPTVSSGAITESGSPVLILDVDDLVRTIDSIVKENRLGRLELKRKNEKAGAKKRILVVDDSVTVREVERKLLENRGYSVTTAVDGIDGWNTVHREEFDLVISDVDMPRMNGFEFVKRIKSDTGLSRVPVMIVSYKDREEDRIKGLHAGANYYLTKSSFHDDTLINAVEDLIGKP